MLSHYRHAPPPCQALRPKILQQPSGRRRSQMPGGHYPPPPLPPRALAAGAAEAAGRAGFAAAAALAAAAGRAAFAGAAALAAFTGTAALAAFAGGGGGCRARIPPSLRHPSGAFIAESSPAQDATISSLPSPSTSASRTREPLQPGP